MCITPSKSSARLSLGYWRPGPWIASLFDATPHARFGVSGGTGGNTSCLSGGGRQSCTVVTLNHPSRDLRRSSAATCSPRRGYRFHPTVARGAARQLCADPSRLSHELGDRVGFRPV